MSVVSIVVPSGAMDFYCAATDEVHAVTVLTGPKDKVAGGEDDRVQL